MSFRRRFLSFVRTVKNAKYEDVDNLFREATSNDDAGAADELVWKIIHAASIGSNNFALIASILGKRIGDIQHPRHVYKGLTLLFHLVQHGENQDAWRRNAIDHLLVLKDLQQYTLFKKEGTLVNSIRRAARTCEELAVNPGKIAELKRKHKEKKLSLKGIHGAESKAQECKVAPMDSFADKEVHHSGAVAVAAPSASSSKSPRSPKPSKTQKEDRPRHMKSRTPKKTENPFDAAVRKSVQDCEFEAAVPFNLVG